MSESEKRGRRCLGRSDADERRKIKAIKVCVSVSACVKKHLFQNT